MAHTVVIGRFGSGKSTFGTMLVLNELKSSDRMIVTTLALQITEINDYLQQEYPTKDFRTLQRVLILTREQLGYFWRFRGIAGFGEYGPEPELWGSVDDLQGRHSDPRWQTVTKGVCYVLDEAPARFHARLWAETGIEFTSYIGQHRKLGDDVYSLARHSSMLDKQFRQTADRCVILDNWYQKSFGRFVRFTAPKRIKYYEYESCPPEKGETPFNQGSLFIDPRGLSRCFNTAGGLGISGVMGGADIGKTAKGLPWWLAIAGVAAGIALFMFTAVRAMSFAMGHRPKIGAVPLPTTNYNASASFLPFANGLPQPRAVSQTAAPPAAAPAPPGPKTLPVCYGYAHLNKRVYLDTDDGLIEGSRLVVSNVVCFLDGIPFHRTLKPLPTPK